MRIVIGREPAGTGGVWCSRLCTAAAADVPAAALAAGLEEEELRLITEEDGGYVLRFKTVEWWEQLRARLEG